MSPGMSSPPARVVRVAKAPKGDLVRPGAEPAPADADARPPSPVPAASSSSPETGSWQENLGGMERSLRLFLVGFVVAPAVIFGTFTALVATSSYAALRSSAISFVGPLGIVLAATILIGFDLTLARTPRRFRARGEERLEVVDFFGQARTLLLGKGFSVHLLEYYPAGLLQRRAAELVRVVAPPHRDQRWIVEEGLLDRFFPAPRFPRGESTPTKDRTS
jgi:hypothetical protein